MPPQTGTAQIAKPKARPPSSTSGALSTTKKRYPRIYPRCLSVKVSKGGKGHHDRSPHGHQVRPSYRPSLTQCSTAPVNDNIMIWQATIIGPQGSPYDPSD